MPVQGEGPTDASKTSEHRKIPPQPDQQLTQDFLNGDYCLRGVRKHCHVHHCLCQNYSPFVQQLSLKSILIDSGLRMVAL